MLWSIGEPKVLAVLGMVDPWKTIGDIYDLMQIVFVVWSFVVARWQHSKPGLDLGSRAGGYISLSII